MGDGSRQSRSDSLYRSIADLTGSGTDAFISSLVALFNDARPGTNHVFLGTDALHRNVLVRFPPPSLLDSAFSNGSNSAVARSVLAGDPVVLQPSDLQAQRDPLLGQLTTATAAFAVVPFHCHSTSHERRHSHSDPAIAAVVACSPDVYTAESALAALGEISPAIAAGYYSAMEFDKIHMRRLVVEKTLGTKDLNSLFHRAIPILQKFVYAEGASVFLWDANRKLLRLSATTGLSEKQRKHDVFYRRDEDRVTVHVARSGNASVTDSIGQDHGRPGKHEEAVQSARQTFLAYPILEWGPHQDPRQAEPIGVLRMINRRLEAVEHDSLVVPFTIEDVDKIEFFCEVLAIIANYLKRADQRIDEFERIMHGVRINIESVVQNLSHFEVRPSLIEIKDHRFDHVIPDCLAHMNDAKWQIERLLAFRREDVGQSMRDKAAALSPVLLSGEVLAPLVAQARKAAAAFNVRRVNCRYADYDSFTQLPAVCGSQEALLTVFRNLLENAIKYSRPGSVCNILLDCEEDSKYVRIRITDNGIGVPQEVEQWMFVDGFRGDNAMRRRPGGGSGIGLAQSRDLMRSMGGDVMYAPIDRMTSFVVVLPRFDQQERRRMP